MNGAAFHFLKEADLVFAVGSSLSKHNMCANIPGRKVIIHNTADTIDHNKAYYADHPVLGDAKLVLFRDAIQSACGFAESASAEGAIQTSKLARFQKSSAIVAASRPQPKRSGSRRGR